MAYNNAKQAVQGFIDQNKEEIAQGAKVADMRAKADKIERALLVERAELEDQIAQLRLKSREEDRFTAEEKKQALLDAQELEDQLLAKEVEALELRRDAQILENSFSRSSKENLDAEARAIADVIQVSVRRTNAQRQTQRELNRVNREIARDVQAKANEEERIQKEKSAKILADEKARVEGIEKILNEYYEKQREIDAETELEKLELEEVRKMEELERLQATEEQKLEIQQYYRERRAELEELERTERLEKEEEKAMKLAEAEENLQNLKMGYLKSGLDFAVGIADEETALGKAVIIAKEALAFREQILSIQKQQTIAREAIMKASVDSVEAGSDIAKGATATAKLGFPKAIPFLIAYALAGATMIASIKQATSKTKRTVAKLAPKGVGAIGGGGGATPSAPRTNTFNVVGSTNTNQIADAIAEQTQEQQPIQAYVVSQDVSTAQEMNDNLVQSATLG